MIQDIIMSLVKTLAVSAAIAGIFYFLDYNFFAVFGLTTVLQFILFAIINTVKDNRLQINIEKEITIREQEYTKQGIDVTCAYCNKTDFVPVRLDETNQFECTHCNQVNSIYINITTAQVTDILSVDPLSVNTFIRDKVEKMDFKEHTDG